MSLTITAVAANIRSLPTQRYIFVRNRIRKAIALAGREGVTFFSECAHDRVAKSPIKRNRKRYSNIVIAEAKRAGKEVYGWDTEIPVVLDTAVWRVTHHEVHLVHTGMRHVSPNRDINQVQAIHRRTGTEAEFDGAHPVSKGHYPASHRGISHLDWRRAMLSKYFAVEASLAAESHEAGRLHLFAGDMNDPTPARIHPNQIGLNNVGLDHIIAVPAPGHWISSVRRGLVRKTRQMDHPIIFATFTQR